VLYQAPGTHFSTRVAGTNPDEKNGATIYSLQITGSDADGLKNWLLLSLYNQVVSQKCFDVLRTKEQLGYIVSAQPSRS